jgi:2',3'-cyclic-nucleotide 2'-phosphodiesterase (5'-nucleotidase family)
MAVLRALLIGLCALSAAPAAAKVVDIVVVHSNDVHGWILPRPERKTARPVGGAAAFAAFVKKERAAADRFLLLDGGDWWQGTPEGSLSDGRAVAEVFDALRYDATVPGNHEFDSGEAALAELARGMKTPVVASNILHAATGAPAPYVRPFLVKDVGGVKVGVFGLITTEMKRLAFPKNIQGVSFPPASESARKAVAALKAQGAEVVVMLSHVGQEYPDRPGVLGDDSVARDVPGIDLVVGGHAHIPIEGGRKVGGTLIVNTGCYLERAGRAVLRYDDQAKKVVDSHATLHPLYLDELGEEPKMKALVEKWRLEVGAALDVAVATAAVALTRDRFKDSSMGNWMTDCLRSWTKTDVAFQNSGGIRKDFAAGPVRLRDVFELMPFDNHVTTLYLKGADLLRVFEHSVGRAPGLMQVSGAKVAYDPSKPEGARVAGVEVRGRALDPEAEYSVTAADFVVMGGDGFSPFDSKRDEAAHETLIRDVLGWCAGRQGTVGLPAEGRYRKL